MRAAKVQASLCIRTILQEPLLLAHTSSESRGTFRQKARSLAPLNSWACAVKVCHDGMLEDTNLLDGAHLTEWFYHTKSNASKRCREKGKEYTTISCLRGQLMTSGNSASGRPQHLRSDGFDCCPQRHEIVVFLPNSYFYYFLKQTFFSET